MTKIHHLLCCFVAVLCLPVSGFSETVSDTLVESKILIKSDTLVKQDCFSYKKLIIPSALIIGGTLLRHSAVNNNVKEFRDRNFGSFQTSFDDYFQYSSVALMFGGNYMGFKSEHSNARMLSNLLVSKLLLTAITLPLKNNIGDLRPDNSACNAFPSGHTAAAFTCATLHFLEYRNSNIWFASTGFMIATTTGALRVMNNRHWVSDITAGAGIGMTTAILTYYFNPLTFEVKKDNRVCFSPTYIDNKAGLALNYNFK
ncbi:phosphatase PAP2 family protein [Flavobacterium sp.]|uniref:phosphatase PAP2 family protein n=1 Tax=Flavobacterium sp. TaxID=239 RepID=UPI002636F499|nr:phosphatase PAP2 family protein [Flavobacterium sp.]